MLNIELPKAYQEALILTEEIAKAQLKAINIATSVILNCYIKNVIELPKHNTECSRFSQKFETRLGEFIVVELRLAYKRKYTSWETKRPYLEWILIKKLATKEAEPLHLSTYWLNCEYSEKNDEGKNREFLVKLNELGLKHLFALDILRRLSK